ncbi:MAG: aspartyl/asparaginyl beta-hydroxylase domain-containing protein [Candidatus Adlerbacteria bacterium]
MQNFRQCPSPDTEIFIAELQKAIDDGKVKFDVLSRVDKNSTGIHGHSAWYSLKSNLPITLEGKDVYTWNSLLVYTTPLISSFPALYTFLKKFADQENSIVRRIAIVGLRAEGEVLPHIDGGAYYARTNRYHLVLVSPNGSEFSSGDERTVLKEGELWWFDNKKQHSVKNLSDALRVHVIFDILPKSRLSFIQRVKLHLFEFCFQGLYDEMDRDEFLRLIERNPFLAKIFML